MGFKRKLRYQRPRRTLGRFIKMRRDDQVLISMTKSEKENADFREKKKVSRYACTGKRYRRHKLGALFTTRRSHWMYHDEGGWTEDIDPTNVAETSRYRRKMEKSEDINATIDKWGTAIDDLIENQSIAPLGCMFSTETPAYLDEPFSAELVVAFADPMSLKRPLRHICWLGPGHLAGAYATGQFENRFMYSSEAYVWDIENSIRPLVTLTSEFAATCIESHDKHSDHLISGHIHGGLALWDLRLGPQPVAVTDSSGSHREGVTSVLWSLDSGGYEVFSGGMEGSIRWWDTRYLEEPLDVITTDVFSEDSRYIAAPGVTALEVNAEDPNKYLVGTQSGHILYGDRTVENPKLEAQWQCPAFIGPVNSLQRSEDCPDIVLSCGDFRVNLFSDDLKYSPIMTLKSESNLITGATWSPSNPAVIHCARVDGSVDTWHLLTDQKCPVHTFKVCDSSLLFVRPRQEGDLLAVGSSCGNLHLVRYTESIYLCDDEDEVHVQDLFSREVSKEMQAAERTSLPCFPNTRISTASDKDSIVSSIKLGGLSIPERWQAYFPIRLNEPPEIESDFFNKLGESQSCGSLGLDSSGQYDLDEWETESDIGSNGGGGENLLSSREECKRRVCRRKSNRASFETGSFHGSTQSERFNSKQQSQRRKSKTSVEHLKKFDPKAETSRQSDGSAKDSKEEIQSHIRLTDDGDKIQRSFSTPPFGGKRVEKTGKSQKLQKKKEYKSKKIIEFVLKYVAPLKAEKKDVTLPKEEIPEELQPIEAEFQTEDMKAVTKGFKKMAKAHRENMWTQFGVPLKEHKKKRETKTEGEGDKNADDDESDSDCDIEDENENGADHEIPMVEETIKMESKEMHAKKKKPKRIEKAPLGSIKSTNTQTGPPRNYNVTPTPKTSLKKKVLPKKQKKTSPKSKKLSPKKVTFDEEGFPTQSTALNPQKSTKEEQEVVKAGGLKKRSTKKRKSKAKKKTASKSPRKVSSKKTPWKL